MASLRVILAVALLLLFFSFAIESRHWNWMNDAQVPHYIVFLMRHGMSPYRQIIDINLPGSYFSEWIGLSFFGNADFGWRFYDYFLLAALTVAAVFITRTYDWLAGLYAGVLFALMHASDGPWFSADRDEVMTVLVVCGYALAFLGTRHRRSLLFFLAAISLGYAFSIKPTAVAFEVSLFVPALLYLRRQGARLLPYLREIAAGTSVIILANLLFLLWRGSLQAFLHRTALTRYYASLDRGSWSYLLHHSTPRGLIFLLPLAIFLFLRSRSWRNWEFQAILGGIFFGVVSYLAQGKGFPYHRYPFMAFALIWAGLEFTTAIRNRGFNRLLGIAGLLIGTLLIGPFYLIRIAHGDSPDVVAKGIANDLTTFPQDQLQGSVQCLDSVYGCYSALYRLQLRQSTGLMGDQLLFPTKVNGTILDLRREFGQQIMAAPPTVFVETNAWPWGVQTFDKVNAWPEFAAFLRNNYTIAFERTYPLSPAEEYPVGYRIYRRNR